MTAERENNPRHEASPYSYCLGEAFSVQPAIGANYLYDTGNAAFRPVDIRLNGAESYHKSKVALGVYPQSLCPIAYTSTTTRQTGTIINVSRALSFIGGAL